MNTLKARIGYAHPSTVDQNLDAQVQALTAAGCGIVRQEQRSGTTLEGRPELKIILDFIHPGETLVVTRIDRLERSRSISRISTCAIALKSASASAFRVRTARQTHLTWPCSKFLLHILA